MHGVFYHGTPARLDGVCDPWSASGFYFCQNFINLLFLLCKEIWNFSFSGRTNTDWLLKSRGISCNWRCNWNIEINLIWDYEFWDVILFFCINMLLDAFWAVWLEVGSQLASNWHTSCFLQCVGSKMLWREAKPRQTHTYYLVKPTSLSRYCETTMTSLSCSV